MKFMFRNESIDEIANKPYILRGFVHYGHVVLR